MVRFEGVPSGYQDLVSDDGICPILPGRHIHVSTCLEEDLESRERMNKNGAMDPVP